MKSKTIFAIALAAVAVSVTGAAVAKDGGRLEDSAFVGVPAALTGTANPVRGLNAGGLPWVIGPAKAEVRAGGKVEVEFRGLLLDPSLPTVGGTNPIGTMKAIVSCLTVAGGTMNVPTPSFTVTTGTGAGAGNGSVEANVPLPSPCLAPIVFIATTADRWLAVSGL
jgi:hypothetical protein